MNVVAVRDDGALLVTDGGQAAAIVLDDGMMLTTRGAALARGDWSYDVVDLRVSPELQRKLRDKLTELDGELQGGLLGEV